MKRNRDQNFGIRWLRDLLCGILIGAGAILPGVSGGVLAVVFDIYRPFMEVLTHPREAIPKYWRWFIPIGLGCAVGFLGFAKGIAAAIDVSSTVTTWLFIGLIVGCLVLVAIVYWLFGTELGASIRATGCNLQMASAQGINTNFCKVLALMLSNGLVGLCGGVYAQYQGSADVNMGRGAIVIGLAAVIIGEAVFGRIFHNFGFRLLGVTLGSIIYYLVLQVVIWRGIDTDLLKLLSALVVAVFLAIPVWKSRYFSKPNHLLTFANTKHKSKIRGGRA